MSVPWSAVSCGPWWACPSRQPLCQPRCAWWGYHRCGTDGDPRESSSYMLIWMPKPMGLCSVCSILWLLRLCTKLFHQFFLEGKYPYKPIPLLPHCRSLEKAEYCLPSLQLHSWQDRVITDAGTHSRHWYPPLQASLWHTTLSAHQWVKHICHTPLLKMQELGHYKKESNALLFEYTKCLLLLEIAPPKL